MNQDTKRLILASILIFLVVVLQQPIFKALGYTIDPKPNVAMNNGSNQTSINQNNQEIVNKEIGTKKIDLNTNTTLNQGFSDSTIEPIDIKIKTKLYTATISNISGGTLIQSELNDYKSYKKDAESNQNVILKPFENTNHCNPCLGYQDVNGNQQYLNRAFSFTNDNFGNVVDAKSKPQILNFTYTNPTSDEIIITKHITFYPDSYKIDHEYEIHSPLISNVELIWKDGLEPVEKNIQSDIVDAVGASIKPINDGKETLRISSAGSSDGDEDNNVIINKSINWAAIQTKYFIAAILPDPANSPISTKMSGESIDGFEGVDFAQSYDIKLSYDNPTTIKTSIYLGPLNVDSLSAVSPDLKNAIYWGWGPMRPIAKLVLWLLNTLYSMVGNYGICLILFAIIIQQITSPLTKKTYQSSQKMQEIQPLVKKIQEKYKNDSKKMNQETMNLYKEKGVNPLGGCLPLLLQMPLLFAIFSVFRHTIELRGMPFFGWISDLSQPDIIFNLPFHIPLYGSHVAFLPILMGISIFLTQKLSMATMDSSQKPMMYAMNGFFILIFNGFPSGLNLYYTVYNLLNYFQQKSIRA